MARLRRLSRRGFLAGTAGLTGTALTGAALLPTPSRAQSPAASGASGPIEVTARRIDTFQRIGSHKQFGRLEFRGGLVLTSNNSEFGGLSGLAMEADGRRFVAIGDAGAWLTGELTYKGTEPAAIRDARLGHLVAQNGRELTRKRDQDAEAIAILDGTTTRGTVLIAFERNQRIGRFPIVDRTVQAPVGYLKMPPEAKSMRSNQGLEAMTVMAGGPYRGAAVAIAERFPQPIAGSAGGGQHVGWMWINGEPRRFSFPDIDGFDCTDVASLADGTLLLLERRFRWLEGVQMRLRLFKPGEIGPDVVGKRGEILLSADMAYDIDNMEGLGVHRGPAGETILTLISDDNFNALLQRTILLQFALT